MVVGWEEEREAEVMEVGLEAVAKAEARRRRGWWRGRRWRRR